MQSLAFSWQGALPPLPPFKKKKRRKSNALALVLSQQQGQENGMAKTRFCLSPATRPHGWERLASLRPRASKKEEEGQEESENLDVDDVRSPAPPQIVWLQANIQRMQVGAQIFFAALVYISVFFGKSAWEDKRRK